MYVAECWWSFNYVYLRNKEATTGTNMASEGNFRDEGMIPTTNIAEGVVVATDDEERDVVTSEEPSGDFATFTDVEAEKYQQEPQSQAYRKRIRFNWDWDVLLRKSAMLCNGHIAEHRQSNLKFEEAVKLFVDTAPQ